MLLIRHGQTPSNLDHLLDTAIPGPGLTELGQEQAEALPAALEGEDIGALFVSTLVRTQITAAPLAAARGLEPWIRDGIRELAAGDLEMRGDREATTTYMRTALRWADGDVAARIPGGEDGVEALGRFDSVVAEAVATGVGTVALVSHGAAIRVWVAARATNVDTQFVAERPLSNTGIVVLESDDAGRWRVALWEGQAVEAPSEALADSGPTGQPVETL
jgi:probable phosphoglycerate mutase